MPRHRGNPEAGRRRERPQLAQQVPDVRLVAGPLAAEHVRVDHDQRVGHATARR